MFCSLWRHGKIRRGLSHALLSSSALHVSKNLTAWWVNKTEWMKGRLNIQQYTAERHGPIAIGDLSWTEALVNTSVGRGREENPKGRRSKRLPAIPFLQLQDKHRNAICREKQGLYTHYTSSGISLPLSFLLSWGPMCWELYWPSEAQLLPVLKCFICWPRRTALTLHLFI